MRDAGVKKRISDRRLSFYARLLQYVVETWDGGQPKRPLKYDESKQTLAAWAKAGSEFEGWHAMFTETNSASKIEACTIFRDVESGLFRIVCEYDKKNDLATVLCAEHLTDSRPILPEIHLPHPRIQVLGAALDPYIFAHGKKKMADRRDPVEDAILGNKGKPDVVELIHGPPGTGKTYQLLRRLLEDVEEDDRGGAIPRTLVVARTNFAVQNLFERAAEEPLLKDRIVLLAREGALNLSLFNKIQNNEIAFDSYIQTGQEDEDDDDDANNAHERKVEINRTPIVFCTVTLSHSKRFEKIHFSRLIVDEACQVPMHVSLNLLEGSVRKVILAGDPQQLPAILSTEGMRVGLHLSLFEYVFCYTIVLPSPLFLCLSLIIYCCLLACLQSLTPYDMSLTIIPSPSLPPSINHLSTQCTLLTIITSQVHVEAQLPDDVP
jgi:hypothetical protein